MRKVVMRISHLHTTLLYQLETAVRGAGKEAAFQISRGDLPFIDGAEPIHVLVRVDRVRNQMTVNLFGGIERHLDNDPVHIAVLIQLFDLGQKLGLGRRSGQLETGGLDSDQLSSFQLHPDVDIAVLTTSDLTDHNTEDFSTRLENFSTKLPEQSQAPA